MADSTVVAQSITVAGAIFAVDDDGAKLWPYAKLAFGAGGTQTEVSTANPLPVQLLASTVTVVGGVSLTAGISSIGVVNAVTSLGTVIAINGVTSLGSIVSALPAGTNNIGTVGQSGTWNISTLTTQLGGTLNVVTAVTSLGSIVSPLPAGGNSIGQTQNIPGTTGGLLKFKLPLAAGLNLTLVKTGAGQVYFISVQSINANPVYLKVFDLAGTANVTMGTTACDYQFMSPANATSSLGTGIALPFDPGVNHVNGIVVALTGSIGFADNTSLAASVAVVTVGYK